MECKRCGVEMGKVHGNKKYCAECKHLQEKDQDKKRTNDARRKWSRDNRRKRLDNMTDEEWEAFRKRNREYEAAYRADPKNEDKVSKHREYGRKYRNIKYHENETANARYCREKKHRLLPGEFDEFMEAQNGKCAICGCSWEDAPRRTLCVDHDHDIKEEYKPGKFRYRIRGLLCGRCNTAIGQFKDSPSIMRNAIRYVEQHQQVTLDLVVLQ